MFGKPKPKTIHSVPPGNMKKKAPPRPPPPSKSRIISRSPSTGFNEQKTKPQQIQRTQTMSCSYNITNRSDLIDLSSPTNSPPKLGPTIPESYPGATSNDVPDFKYHIGASIFYVKSELKSNASSKPVVNPFSPPRPSPQSMLTKVSTTNSPSRQPTIIKANNTPTSESLNNNNYGIRPQTQSSSNVLLEWDEPPKKTSVAPTVIRPIPPPKKPGLASIRLNDRNSLPGPPTFVLPPVPASIPRYDDPPEESDDELDDSFSLNPVPEPEEPPPPPPADLDPNGLQDQGQQFDNVSNPPFQNYGSDTVDQAYGIALYDYVSSEPGDLQFYAGDVIYLSRFIDESWLFGSCGALEGMFPSNFINIVVPLDGGGFGQGTYSESNSSNENQSALTTNDIYAESKYYPTHYVQAVHSFEATEPNDLGIKDGDIITVIGQINEDWLYGELHGQKGQFPASFLEYIPGNLPYIDPQSQ